MARKKAAKKGSSSETALKNALKNAIEAKMGHDAKSAMDSRRNKLPVSSFFLPWTDHVIPLPMEVGSFDIKTLHLLVRDLKSF